MTPAAQRSEEARPATARLADFILSAVVPPAALRAAATAVVDTIAVTVAGGRTEPAARFRAAFERTSGGSSVPCLWDEYAYRAEDAALVFGMASHILDYDDVSMLAVCHPSAPVLMASICAASWTTLSGRELCEALAIGTEVMIRLGQAMGFRHYELGFHATGTLGTVAAAAACCRLMKLTPERMVNALAIAASEASGLRKNFGSMVKSLHVGLAASNGLRAARWAAAGIEGASEPIERDGFLFAFSGGATNSWSQEIALGRPFAIVEPGFERKRYPCCYMLHKMVEGALRLARTNGVTLGDVERVRVEVPAGGARALIHPYPATGLEALFSAPYAIAACLADQRLDLASFTDAAVQRPEIRSRLRSVDVVERAADASRGGEVGSGPAHVSLSLKDGTELAATVHAMPGSPQDPILPDQLRAKWNDCLGVHENSLAATDSRHTFETGLRMFEMASLSPWFSAVRALATSSARREERQ